MFLKSLSSSLSQLWQGALAPALQSITTRVVSFFNSQIPDHFTQRPREDYRLNQLIETTNSPELRSFFKEDVSKLIADRKTSQQKAPIKAILAEVREAGYQSKQHKKNNPSSDSSHSNSASLALTHADRAVVSAHSRKYLANHPSRNAPAPVNPPSLGAALNGAILATTGSPPEEAGFQLLAVCALVAKDKAEKSEGEKKSVGFTPEDSTELNLIFPPTIEDLNKAAPGYTFERVLGRGGTAIVYEVITTEGKKRALKIFDPRYKNWDFVTQEYHSLSSPSDPSTNGHLQAFSHGGIRGLDYIELEYCPSTVMEFSQTKSGKKLVDILLGILEAGESYHQRGHFHRDIKPENILVNPQGALKLADASHVVSTNATQYPFVGSFHYLAPELLFALSINNQILEIRPVASTWKKFEAKKTLPSYLYSPYGNQLPREIFFQLNQDEAGDRLPRTTYLSEQFALGRTLIEVILGEDVFDSILTTHTQPEERIRRLREVLTEVCLKRSLHQGLVDILLKASADDPNLRYISLTQMKEEIESLPVFDRWDYLLGNDVDTIVPLPSLPENDKPGIAEEGEELALETTKEVSGIHRKGDRTSDSLIPEALDGAS